MKEHRSGEQTRKLLIAGFVRRVKDESSDSSRPLSGGVIKKVGDNGLTRGREKSNDFGAERPEEADLSLRLLACLKVGVLIRDDRCFYRRDAPGYNTRRVFSQCRENR